MASGHDYAGAPPDSSAYPRWPLWLPLAALGAGLAAGLVMVGVLGGILSAAGVNTSGSHPASRSRAPSSSTWPWWPRACCSRGW